MDWSIVEKAKEFAIEKHKGQMYGKHPYSFHLSGVAKLAGIRDRFPEHRAEVLASCWLHDTMEDTPTTGKELLDIFGPRIAHVVWLLTKTGEPYEDYMLGILSSPIVIEVKKCDTMFNLGSSFKEGNQKRIAKYIKQLDILERGYV